MITAADAMPLAGTIEGFFVGLVAGYAIKKIMNAVVIVELFIAALAYLRYHRIIDVKWIKIQAIVKQI
jgi:uncharacterized membrane protein (Fun14 family)